MGNRYNQDIMYVKKLIKIGRSYYALIPSVLLQLLSIDPDKDQMKITLEENKIIFEKTENEKTNP